MYTFIHKIFGLGLIFGRVLYQKQKNRHKTKKAQEIAPKWRWEIRVAMFLSILWQSFLVTRGGGGCLRVLKFAGNFLEKSHDNSRKQKTG